MFNAPTRRFGIGISKDGPCLHGCCGSGNKGDDCRRQGANNRIHNKLVLANPDVVSRVRSGCCIHSQSFRRARFGAIDITKEIITSEEGLELNLPRHIVGGSEFERRLSGDVDGD